MPAPPAGPARQDSTVFVYGLLKSGLELSHLLEGQQFLSMARSAPFFRLSSLEGGQFPGLTGPVADGHGRSVVGELWRVSAACLVTLDEAEGIAEGLYERRVIPLAAPHTSVHAEAYFYLGSVDGCPEADDSWPV